jgi:hypothetical protein
MGPENNVRWPRPRGYQSQAGPDRPLAVFVGVRQDFTQTVLPLRDCLASVPFAKPRQSIGIAQRQITSEETGQAEGVVVAVLPLAQTRG